MPIGGKTLEERFWCEVDKNSHPLCWLWTGGSRKGNGYGDIRVGVNTRPAHRVSWGLHNGIIPEGLFVLHKCDNPSCVNPDHLFLGTHQDNMDDMVMKGRSYTGPHKPNPNTFDRRGENNVKSILTDAQVYELRSKYMDGTFTSTRKEAEIYKVSPRCISLIINNIRRVDHTYTVLKGENKYNKKITHDERCYIISLLPTHSDSQLSVMFGVSRKLIWLLRRGR